MAGRASLMVVLGFGIILMYLGRNMNDYSTQAVSNMASYAEMSGSHTAAVDGAEVGLSLLYADSLWRGPVTQDLSGSSYTVRAIDHLTSVELLSVSRYLSTSGLLHDTVRVTLRRTTTTSFALYAWMTEFEGNFFWTDADTIWGPMHSNGRIHINGSPVFFGKVTVTKGFDPPKVGKGTNRAVFKDTYETGTAPITFPSNISEIMNAATAGGHLYNTEIWVELNASGKVYIRTIEGGAIVDSVSLSDPLFNGAIASMARVNVEGTLKGMLSIGSATDIRITGDIRYGDRTRDLLGLIARNNVVIGDTPANRDGVGIDACIFANTGSFEAEGTINGPFDFFGSIAQYDRAKPFGTMRRLRYDERLSDPSFRPLWYPGYVSETLAITNWWESYRVLAAR